MSLIGHFRDGAREARLTLDATKRALRQSLEMHPRAAARVGHVRRGGRVLAFRVRSRLADIASGDPYLAVGRVFYVPMAELRRRTELPYEYNPTRRPGAVVPGDWDQPQWTIEESPYWAEFREALEGSRPWAGTAAFRAEMKPVEAEPMGWRRRIMEADAQRAIRAYELLYESMRSAGCLPQRELAKRRSRGYQATNVDDISIGVGRTGELLLCQGGHRVEAARSLNITAVPVWVGVRHPEWWTLRKRILTYTQSHDGRAPEPLLHPDLDNIPYSCDYRTSFDLVSAALWSSRGLLVDASPGWGYFLHRFEALGFDCTGIASVAEDRYFLDRLRVASNRHFAVVEDVDSAGVPCEEPVVALLLLRDTGPWLSSATTREALATLLAKTRPRHVFVQGDAPEGSGRSGTHTAAAASEAVRFCAATMALPHVQLLGHSGARPIYHLSEHCQTAKAPA